MLIYSLILSAVLSLSSGEPTKPPKPSKPPKQPELVVMDVIVQERGIYIPRIPACVEQAHVEYGKIGPMIRNGIQDLETELVQLLARDAEKWTIAVTLRVRSREVEAARFFAKMLNDEHYIQLQASAIKAWDAWQLDVLNFGSVNGYRKEQVPGIIVGEDAYLKTKLRAQETLLAMKLGMGKNNMCLPSFDDTDDYDLRVTTSNMRKIIANKNAPPLSRSWNELIDYVNTCAIRMANLDAPPSPYLSEGLVKLQLKAKIDFLERCRVTLWCCHGVWAQMTSSNHLPPLKNLSGFPQASATKLSKG